MDKKIHPKDLGIHTPPAGFSIPKIKKKPTKAASLNYLAPTDRDSSNVINEVNRTCLDPEQKIRQQWKLNVVHSVIPSSSVETRYREKRVEMKEQGGNRLLQEVLGFYICRDRHLALDIAKSGIKTNPFVKGNMGDPSQGVYLFKYLDVALLSQTENKNVFILVFKVLPGRVKQVPVSDTGLGLSAMREPTPNYDCHISQATAHSGESVFAMSNKSQMYIYEYTDDAVPSHSPRQCLPYALLEFTNLCDSKTDGATSAIRPKISTSAANAGWTSTGRRQQSAESGRNSGFAFPAYFPTAGDTDAGQEFLPPVLGGPAGEGGPRLAHWESFTSRPFASMDMANVQPVKPSFAQEGAHQFQTGGAYFEGATDLRVPVDERFEHEMTAAPSGQFRHPMAPTAVKDPRLNRGQDVSVASSAQGLWMRRNSTPEGLLAHSQVDSSPKDTGSAQQEHSMQGIGENNTEPRAPCLDRAPAKSALKKPTAEWPSSSQTDSGKKKKTLSFQDYVKKKKAEAQAKLEEKAVLQSPSMSVDDTVKRPMTGGTTEEALIQNRRPLSSPKDEFQGCDYHPPELLQNETVDSSIPDTHTHSKPDTFSSGSPKPVRRDPRLLSPYASSVYSLQVAAGETPEKCEVASSSDGATLSPDSQENPSPVQNKAISFEKRKEPSMEEQKDLSSEDGGQKSGSELMDITNHQVLFADFEETEHENALSMHLDDASQSEHCPEGEVDVPVVSNQGISQDVNGVDEEHSRRTAKSENNGSKYVAPFPDTTNSVIKSEVTDQIPSIAKGLIQRFSLVTAKSVGGKLVFRCRALEPGAQSESATSSSSGLSTSSREDFQDCSSESSEMSLTNSTEMGQITKSASGKKQKSKGRSKTPEADIPETIDYAMIRLAKGLRPGKSIQVSGLGKNPTDDPLPVLEGKRRGAKKNDMEGKKDAQKAAQTTSRPQVKKNSPQTAVKKTRKKRRNALGTSRKKGRKKRPGPAAVVSSFPNSEDDHDVDYADFQFDQPAEFSDSVHDNKVTEGIAFSSPVSGEKDQHGTDDGGKLLGCIVKTAPGTEMACVVETEPGTETEVSTDCWRKALPLSSLGLHHWTEALLLPNLNPQVALVDLIKAFHGQADFDNCSICQKVIDQSMIKQEASHGDSESTQAALNAGKTPTTAVDAGKTPTTAEDEGKTPTISVDAGKIQTTAVDAGKTPTTAVNSGQTPTTAVHSGQTPTTAVHSGQTTTTAVDSGQTTTTAVDSGQTTTTAVDSGQTPTTAVDSGQTTTTAVDSEKTNTAVDSEKTNTAVDSEKTTTSVNLGKTTPTLTSGKTLDAPILLGILPGNTLAKQHELALPALLGNEEKTHQAASSSSDTEAKTCTTPADSSGDTEEKTQVASSSLADWKNINKDNDASSDTEKAGKFASSQLSEEPPVVYEKFRPSLPVKGKTSFVSPVAGVACRKPAVFSQSSTRQNWQRWKNSQMLKAKGGSADSAKKQLDSDLDSADSSERQLDSDSSKSPSDSDAQKQASGSGTSVQNMQGGSWQTAGYWLSIDDLISLQSDVKNKTEVYSRCASKISPTKLSSFVSGKALPLPNSPPKSIQGDASTTDATCQNWPAKRDLGPLWNSTVLSSDSSQSAVRMGSGDQCASSERTNSEIERKWGLHQPEMSGRDAMKTAYDIKRLRLRRQTEEGSSVNSLDRVELSVTRQTSITSGSSLKYVQDSPSAGALEGTENQLDSARCTVSQAGLSGSERAVCDENTKMSSPASSGTETKLSVRSERDANSRHVKESESSSAQQVDSQSSSESQQSILVPQEKKTDFFDIAIKVSCSTKKQPYASIPGLDLLTEDSTSTDTSVNASVKDCNRASEKVGMLSDGSLQLEKASHDWDHKEKMKKHNLQDTELQQIIKMCAMSEDADKEHGAAKDKGNMSALVTSENDCNLSSGHSSSFLNEELDIVGTPATSNHIQNSSESKKKLSLVFQSLEQKIERAERKKSDHETSSDGDLQILKKDDGKTDKRNAAEVKSEKDNKDGGVSGCPIPSFTRARSYQKNDRKEMKLMEVSKGNSGQNLNNVSNAIYCQNIRPTFQTEVFTHPRSTAVDKESGSETSLHQFGRNPQHAHFQSGFAYGRTVHEQTVPVNNHIVSRANMPVPNMLMASVHSPAVSVPVSVHPSNPLVMSDSCRSMSSDNGQHGVFVQPRIPSLFTTPPPHLTVLHTPPLQLTGTMTGVTDSSLDSVASLQASAPVTPSAPVPTVETHKAVDRGQDHAVNTSEIDVISWFAKREAAEKNPPKKDVIDWFSDIIDKKRNGSAVADLEPEIKRARLDFMESLNIRKSGLCESKENVSDSTNRKMSPCESRDAGKKDSLKRWSSSSSCQGTSGNKKAKVDPGKVSFRVALSTDGVTRRRGPLFKNVDLDSLSDSEEFDQQPSDQNRNTSNSTSEKTQSVASEACGKNVEQTKKDFRMCDSDNPQKGKCNSLHKSDKACLDSKTHSGKRTGSDCETPSDKRSRWDQQKHVSQKSSTHSDGHSQYNDTDDDMNDYAHALLEGDSRVKSLETKTISNRISDSILKSVSSVPMSSKTASVDKSSGQKSSSVTDKKSGGRTESQSGKTKSTLTDKPLEFLLFAKEMIMQKLQEEEETAEVETEPPQVESRTDSLQKDTVRSEGTKLPSNSVSVRSSQRKTTEKCSADVELAKSKKETKETQSRKEHAKEVQNYPVLHTSSSSPGLSPAEESQKGKSSMHQSSASAGTETKAFIPSQENGERKTTSAHISQKTQNNPESNATTEDAITEEEIIKLKNIVCQLNYLPVTESDKPSTASSTSSTSAKRDISPTSIVSTGTNRDRSRPSCEKDQPKGESIPVLHDRPRPQGNRAKRGSSGWDWSIFQAPRPSRQTDSSAVRRNYYGNIISDVSANSSQSFPHSSSETAHIGRRDLPQTSSSVSKGPVNTESREKHKLPERTDSAQFPNAHSENKTLGGQKHPMIQKSSSDKDKNSVQAGSSDSMKQSVKPKSAEHCRSVATSNLGSVTKSSSQQKVEFGAAMKPATSAHENVGSAELVSQTSPRLDSHPGTNARDTLYGTRQASTLKEFLLEHYPQEDPNLLVGVLGYKLTTDISRMPNKVKNNIQFKVRKHLEANRSNSNCPAPALPRVRLEQFETDQIELELRLVEGCLKLLEATQAIQTLNYMSSGVDSFRHASVSIRDALSMVVNDFNSAIKDKQRSWKGRPHQRMPCQLLLHDEQDKMYTHEHVFTMLMASVPCKPYSRLLEFKEEIEDLLARKHQASINKQDFLVKQTTKHIDSLRNQRGHMMRTFTGVVSVTRFRKVKNIHNHYATCRFHLLNVLGDDSVAKMSFFRTTYESIEQHLQILEKELK